MVVVAIWQPDENTKQRQKRGPETAPKRTIWVEGPMPEAFCQKLMDLYGIFANVCFSARESRRRPKPGQPRFARTKFSGTDLGVITTSSRRYRAHRRGAADHERRSEFVSDVLREGRRCT